MLSLSISARAMRWAAVSISLSAGGGLDVRQGWVEMAAGGLDGRDAAVDQQDGAQRIDMQGLTERLDLGGIGLLDFPDGFHRGRIYPIRYGRGKVNRQEARP